MTCRDETKSIKDLLSDQETQIQSQMNTLLKINDNMSEHKTKLHDLSSVVMADRNNNIELDLNLNKRITDERNHVLEIFNNKTDELEVSVKRIKNDLMEALASTGTGTIDYSLLDNNNMDPKMKSFLNKLISNNELNRLLTDSNMLANFLNGNGNSGGNRNSSINPYYFDEDEDVAILSDLCMKFEDQSVQRSFVLDLSVKMCETLTRISQNHAFAIAKDSDSEIVCNSLNYTNDNEIVISEDSVNKLREEKVLSFMNKIRAVVVERYPQPGVIRLDSREKFFKKLKLAIDMCLSKYDQV